MNEALTKQLKALTDHLEKRAKEIEEPMEMHPEVAKVMDPYCRARAAGIRDAIHLLQLTFPAEKP